MAPYRLPRGARLIPSLGKHFLNRHVLPDYIHDLGSHIEYIVLNRSSTLYPILLSPVGERMVVPFVKAGGVFGGLDGLPAAGAVEVSERPESTKVAIAPWG